MNFAEREDLDISLFIYSKPKGPCNRTLVSISPSLAELLRSKIFSSEPQVACIALTRSYSKASETEVPDLARAYELAAS